MSAQDGLWRMAPDPRETEKLTDELRELLAQSWEDGNRAGADDQAHWDGWNYEPGYHRHENPYRK